MRKEVIVISILKSLFLPTAYWKLINEMNPSWRWTTFRLLLPLVIVVTVSNWTSILLFGGFRNYSTALSFIFAIIIDICAFALLNIASVIARPISRIAKGKTNYATVYNLICFSAIPIAVSSFISPLLRSIRIWIAIFPVLFSLYSVVLLYFGVGGLLGIHKKKVFVTILLILMPFFIIGLLLLIVDLFFYFLVDLVFQG
jgi:hypothetical protein